MNTLRFALAAAITVAAAAAHAEEVGQVTATAEAPTQTVTVNPLVLAFGALDVQYEAAIDAGTSWFAGPRIGTGVLGYAGLTGGARFFLNGAAPEGTYLSPVGSLAYGHEAVMWSLGGQVGHTWIFDRRWVVSVAGGLQYASFAVAGLGFSGLYPDVRLAVGGAF